MANVGVGYINSLAVSAGLYFGNNKPRVTIILETAYNTDAKAFIQTETARTAKSQNDLALGFQSASSY